MLYKTMRFGEIEIQEEKVITFPWGIPGFPQQKRYYPIEYKEDGSLSFLQSLDMPDLTFIIADPFKFLADYVVDIADDDLEALEIKQPEEALVYVILTVRPGGKEITANLAAPLVINARKRIGRQIILLNSPYDAQFPLTNGQAAGK